MANILSTETENQLNQMISCSAFKLEGQERARCKACGMAKAYRTDRMVGEMSSQVRGFTAYPN